VTAITGGKLSLERFILEMARAPREQLDLESLKQLMNRLDVSDDLLQQHIRFTNRCYSRNLVCRTPDFDLLVLCWRPGQQSVIHDHGESLSVVRVVNGHLTSRMFEKSGQPTPSDITVRKTADEILTDNAFACVDHGEIHQLANVNGPDLVTLHCYARPLKTMNVYTPATGEVEEVTLRYTLEDDYV
jgi:predicted metal-dependent enzyme (double-stranded beta helix superfamily)